MLYEEAAAGQRIPRAQQWRRQRQQREQQQRQQRQQVATP
jgi:hypothetical protein